MFIVKLVWFKYYRTLFSLFYLKLKNFYCWKCVKILTFLRFSNRINAIQTTTNWWSFGFLLLTNIDVITILKYIDSRCKPLFAWREAPRVMHFRRAVPKVGATWHVAKIYYNRLQMYWKRLKAYTKIFSAPKWRSASGCDPPDLRTARNYLATYVRSNKTKRFTKTICTIFKNVQDRTSYWNTFSADPIDYIKWDALCFGQLCYVSRA